MGNRYKLQGLGDKKTLSGTVLSTPKLRKMTLRLSGSQV